MYLYMKALGSLSSIEKKQKENKRKEIKQTSKYKTLG